jgi:uncharacterized protein (TIGR02145 family)
MKAIKLIISILLSGTITTFAQNQQSFSYQAVVRNSAGELIVNQNVGFRTSIRDVTQTGSLLYRETHSSTTNQFGLATLHIGNGTPVSGSFSSINWGDGKDKFLQVEIDVNGGSNYTQMGTTQLLSVPFSLNAKTTSGLTVMTSAERDAITTPETGMQLFNSDTHRINYFDGYGWLEITGVRQADFTCGNPLLDSRDGTYYNTVEINGRCWMAENINIGTMIQGTTNPSNDGVIEKYCYSDNPGLCDTYGGLYQWNEVMQYSYNEGAQGLCPEGWHVPADAEWTELVNATGGPNYAGAYLVQGGGSGFEALMAGYREPQLSGYPFAFIGSKTYFWTSKNGAVDRYIVNNDPHIYTETTNIEYGFSVRCIKD